MVVRTKMITVTAIGQELLDAWDDADHGVGARGFGRCDSAVQAAVDEIERLRDFIGQIKAHAEWQAGPSDSDEALHAIKLLAQSALEPSPVLCEHGIPKKFCSATHSQVEPTENL
jgi:hypothetical protein